MREWINDSTLTLERFRARTESNLHGRPMKTPGVDSRPRCDKGYTQASFPYQNSHTDRGCAKNGEQ